MEGARRLLLAGVAVVALEALIGVAGLIALGPAMISLYLLACAAATAGVIGWAVHLVIPPRGDDEDGRDGGDGGGQPPWWPGFERDFWRHVRERERTPV